MNLRPWATAVARLLAAPLLASAVAVAATKAATSHDTPGQIQAWTKPAATAKHISDLETDLRSLPHVRGVDVTPREHIAAAVAAEVPQVSASSARALLSDLLTVTYSHDVETTRARVARHPAIDSIAATTLPRRHSTLPHLLALGAALAAGAGAAARLRALQTRARYAGTPAHAALVLTAIPGSIATLMFLTLAAPRLAHLAAAAVTPTLLITRPARP